MLLFKYFKQGDKEPHLIQENERSQFFEFVLATTKGGDLSMKQWTSQQFKSSLPTTVTGSGHQFCSTVGAMAENIDMIVRQVTRLCVAAKENKQQCRSQLLRLNKQY